MTGDATSSGGSRRVLTAAWLADRYVRQGVSVGRIGVETGWSSLYVRDRLRQYGIALRPPGVMKNPVDRAALLGCLEQGWSVAELATRTVLDDSPRIRQESPPRPQYSTAPAPRVAAPIVPIRREQLGQLSVAM